MAAAGVRLPASTAASLVAQEACAPRLSCLLEGQLGRLLPAYTEDAGAAEALRRLFRLLTAESLDRPAAPPFEGLSFINADGLPFQWVLSLGAEAQGVGFLCEIGHAGAAPQMRLAQSLDRIEAACRLLHGAGPSFLREAAAILLPRAEAPWPEHWRSAVWIGVALRGDTIGLKPYFNLNRGACRERWLRAGWVLKALGREAALAQLCAISSHCSADSWPVGLAFDIGRDGGIGRVKLYFRSSATSFAWLVRWHEKTGLAVAEPEVRRFLDLFGPANRRALPDGAMVVSLEFHADERMSLKSDLAVTKWAGTDGTLLEAASAFLGSDGKSAARLDASAAALGLGANGETALLRFAGLGLEPDGATHLNLYVEPPLTPPAENIAKPARALASPTAVTHAVRKGTAALLGALAENHWEDFALPVGASDAWVTGYILAMLADLPAGLRARLRPELEAPLAWLTEQRHALGGWGYNSGVPADADSTAWAILALRAWGIDPPPEAPRFLALFRDADGFRTYPPNTSPSPSWTLPVPDVSAVAARALGEPGTTLAESAELAPAYWWTSRVYTTAMRLDGGAGPVPPALRRQLARIAPAGAFDRALLLRARIRAGLPVRGLAAELVEDQGRDGLWPASARLRLADGNPEAPWRRIDSGTLYTDTRGLFTTATAVAALALRARIF